MSELQLVLEIEKYPCLYNTQLPEYLRKEVTEKCWKVIAEKRGLTVEECKEKWRNIRSAFSRSLKPGGKPKRPYYLKEHLQFIMPFIKTRNKMDNGASLPNLDDEQQQQDPEMNNADDDEDDDDEDYEYPTADNFQNEVPERNEPSSSRPCYNYESCNSRPRKRTHTDVTDMDEAFTSYLSKRFSRDRSEERRRDSVPVFSPIHHFMISLLPEFDSMTEDQIRSFKIRVLMMIDEIKNPRSVHASTDRASNNSAATCAIKIDTVESLI